MKLRTVAGGALVLGVVAGIWLSDLFKGFGWGPGTGKSSDAKSVVTSVSEAGSAEIGADGEDLKVSTTTGQRPLRVVIKDRSYFLRQGPRDVVIALDQLVRLIADHPGDEDGLRVRIDRAESARVTAELQLREALTTAEVPESATLWSPEAASSR